MDSLLNCIIFLSFFGSSSFGHITVYNGNVPDNIQNAGAVNLARVGGTDDASPASAGGGSGIIQHNLHVASQSNYALDSRRKRFIIQNIDTVHKQINISKRNVTTQEGNTGTILDGNGRVKRFIQDVHKINKQVNIDMGNRRKRYIIQNIDYVHKQINQS